MTHGIKLTAIKYMAMSAAIALVGWSIAGAQKASPPPETQVSETEEAILSPPSLDQVKTLRSEAEAATNLSDPDKKSVLAILDQAISALEEAERLNADTLKLTERVRSVPARMKEIEAQLSRKTPPAEQIVDPAAAARMTKPELDQREREERASVAALRESLKIVQDQIEVLNARPALLPKDSAEAMRRLSEVRKDLKADSPAPDESRIFSEARRTKLLAEHFMLKAQIQIYEQQLVHQEILTSLLSAERDLANHQLAQAEVRAQAWQAIAQERRQQEALQIRMDAEVAKSLAPDLPPPVKDQYETNIKLGKELEQLTDAESRTARELDQLQAELKRLEDEFAQIRQRVQGLSLSETIGLTLRQRSRELPGPETYSRRSAQRQQIISQVGEAQFVIDEKQLKLKDLKAETERIMESLPSISGEDNAQLRDRIQTLLKDRRDLFDKLENTYRRYYQNLQSLEFTEQHMLTVIDEYADFLDGRLLWMRSSKIFGLDDLRNLPPAIFWIINPANWWGTVEDFVVSFRRTPIIWVLGFLLTGILFAGRLRVKRRLEQLSKNVGRVRKDSFMTTVYALGLTLYLASSWPFLLVLAGWLLSASPVASDFGRAAGFGALVAGHIWAIVNFLNYLCREKGVAQIHFRWQDQSRLTLRRQALWIKPLWVPLIFLIATIEASNKVLYGNSLGRLAFLTVIIAAIAFVTRMRRMLPGGSADVDDTSRKGLLFRLRFFWYPSLFVLPGILFLLAFMGYYYTALRLSWQFHYTALLVFALVLGHNLALRWLVIAQRRLAYEDTVRKRKEKLEAEHLHTAEAPSSAASPQIDSFEVEEPEISQAQVTEQTRDLLQTLLFFSGLIGLWLIWNDVLPAMQMLEDIRLWSYSVEADGVRQVVPITLTNVLFAILIAAITFVGARNLPGVLEITLLKYLPLDAGARYAFSTICQYVAAAIGVIVAFNYIGIDWSGLKWLVAALGVGIGFGLQEIIANFVSGLIILFERPVRIGDIVTVGDVDGVVSRIRIRATTITNWDRKEYLVPNKEFITGRVLNWTLSNAVNRVVITIGVAYGSDTVLARELLIKAAHEHPNILKDPAPIATFEGFGDNALNCVLRCFLPNLDNRLVTITELHTAIDKSFKQAGITIAFPQRDIHLDQIGRLDVNVVSNQADQVPETNQNQ